MLWILLIVLQLATSYILPPSWLPKAKRTTASVSLFEGCCSVIFMSIMLISNLGSTTTSRLFGAKFGGQAMLSSSGCPISRSSPNLPARAVVHRRAMSNSKTKESKIESPPSDSTDASTNPTGSKITWMRGYLGAHSNTDPPDAVFLGVAAVVTGAGFYAWFIEPPTSE